tara:strand:- start:11 stop:1114 length:1104 start_codon:yes stop_codon:yes gene_type:complete
MITFSTEKKISYENVIKNLHILDYDYFFKITNHILNHDASSCILILDEILKLGFESNNFITGLSEHFRNLLICKDENITNLLEVSEGVKSKYKKQSSSISKELLINGIDILNTCDVNYKLSSHTRLHTELALVKLSDLEKKTSQNKEDNLSEQKNKEEEKVVEKKQKKETSSQIKEEEKKQEIEKADLEEKTTKESEEESEEKETPENIKKDVYQKETPDLNSIFSSDNKKDKEEKIIKDETQNQSEEILDFHLKNLNTTIEKYKQFKKITDSQLSILNKDFTIEKNMILIDFLSDLEKEIFEGFKKNLLNHIRKVFDNQTIDFSIALKKNNKGKKLYTGKDKFEFLTENNKEIKNLQKQLGLDYEF